MQHPAPFAWAGQINGAACVTFLSLYLSFSEMRHWYCYFALTSFSAPVCDMFRYYPAVQISSFPSLLSYLRCQRFANCCRVTMTSRFGLLFPGEKHPVDDERSLFWGESCYSWHHLLCWSPPKPGPLGGDGGCSLVLCGKGCWGAMLLRGTHRDGSPLGQQTGPAHRPRPSPLLSPRFPLSTSDLFIPEGAAEPPSGWAPAAKRQSPLTLAC